MTVALNYSFFKNNRVVNQPENITDIFKKIQMFDARTGNKRLKQIQININTFLQQIHTMCQKHYILVHLNDVVRQQTGAFKVVIQKTKYC